MGKINDKGISLIILVLTIIIIMIIASVTIYYGTETINKANIETVRTNMLLIKAKASEYCEEANFKLGTARPPELAEGQELTEEFIKYLEPGMNYLKNINPETGEKQDENRPSFESCNEYYDMTHATNKQLVTKINETNAKLMGVKGVEKLDKYLILFDIIENKVEIFFIEGVKTKVEGQETTVNSLTDIEKI